jgi:hypothetical protein
MNMTILIVIITVIFCYNGDTSAISDYLGNNFSKFMEIIAEIIKEIIVELINQGNNRTTYFCYNYDIAEIIMEIIVKLIFVIIMRIIIQ